MLLWLIAGLHLLGFAAYLCLKKVFKKKRCYFRRMAYWVLFGFVAIVSLVLYLNQVAIGVFFNMLATPKMVAVAVCLLLIWAVFEVASPVNFFRHLKKMGPGRGEGLPRFNEKEYEGFLKLVSGTITVFLILLAPIGKLLGLLGSESEQAGVLCITGIVLAVHLPLCIRQIVYYLHCIKRLEPDEGALQKDKSYAIASRFTGSKNKKL